MAFSTKIDFSFEVLSQFIDDKFLNYICPDEADVLHDVSEDHLDQATEPPSHDKALKNLCDGSSERLNGVLSKCFNFQKFCWEPLNLEDQHSNEPAKKSNVEVVTENSHSENLIKTSEKCKLQFSKNKVEYKPKKEFFLPKEHTDTSELRHTTTDLSDHNYCFKGPLEDRTNTPETKIIDSLFATPYTGQNSLMNMMYRCWHAGCTRMYSKKTHLRMHVRRHNGERPFKCLWPNCLWRFSRSDELSRHMRSHSGERPYACGSCGKRFARSDHLSKHHRIHNKKKLCKLE